MQNRNVHIDELILVRPEKTLRAMLCCCFFSRNIDYDGIIPYLHEQERRYFSTLKFERRMRSYLMGRFTAKQAVAALTGESNLSNILIETGIFAQPIVMSNKQNIQVSITHCDDFGAAIAFPEEHPMGIDLEQIDANKREILQTQITEDEKTEIGTGSFSYMTGLTLLWTVKEALSKVLKTGLMTPFAVFEISKIDVFDNCILCTYKNFAQYKAISFTIGNYMCSIVYPLKSQLYLNIPSLQANFVFNHPFSEIKKAR